MNKIFLATILVCLALAHRIPLKKIELEKKNIEAKKLRLASPQFEKEAKLKLSNPLNSVIPVNDFMDTQYLAEIRIGSPA